MTDTQTDTQTQPQPAQAPTVAPSEELHTFHYPSHSVVVRLTIVDDPAWTGRCAEHEHTRTGAHLIRSTHLFTTYEEAERYVVMTENVGATPGVNLTVTALRHPVEPIGSRLAIKIDAERGRNGNVRRGWLIFTAGGRSLGFVDEGLEGPIALAVVGDVIELAAIEVMPRVYREHLRQPYPHTI